MTVEAVVPVTETTEADLIRARAEAQALRGEVERLTDVVRQARAAHHSDLTIIGEALKETADRSEWCSEYDDGVNAVVARLSFVGAETFREAASRVREFTVRFSGSVTIEASSSDDAAEIFSGDPSSYIDSYGIEVDEVYAD